VIMLTPVYRDRISLDKHRGVEPGASSAINHLAVNDLDINQRGGSLPVEYAITPYAFSGHIMAWLGFVGAVIRSGQTSTNGTASDQSLTTSPGVLKAHVSNSTKGEF